MLLPLCIDRSLERLQELCCHLLIPCVIRVRPVVSVRRGIESCVLVDDDDRRLGGGVRLRPSGKRAVQCDDAAGSRSIAEAN
jgi:hypothetical protein